MAGGGKRGILLGGHGTSLVVEGRASSLEFVGAARVAGELNGAMLGRVLPAPAIEGDEGSGGERKHEAGAEEDRAPFAVVKAHPDEAWSHRLKQLCAALCVSEEEVGLGGVVVYRVEGRYLGGEWELLELARSAYGLSSGERSATLASEGGAVKRGALGVEGAKLSGRCGEGSSSSAVFGYPEALSLRRALMAASARAWSQEEVAKELVSNGGKTALILVDIQYDFCEGGSLAVPEGSSIIPVVNELRKTGLWDVVVLTQDWHPPSHLSFASNNEGAEPFTEVELPPPTGRQMMWPDHCVQGSRGAEFHADLERAEDDVVVRKGMVEAVDSYSGFGDASETKELEETPLRALLTERGVKNVFVAGLAADYCVAFTAKDALRFGFNTWLITDATKEIDRAVRDKEWATCSELGGKFIKAEHVPTSDHIRAAKEGSGETG